MKPDTVTASEIAGYVYCPEAWRLSRVDAPVTPQAKAALIEGTVLHAEKAVVEVVAARSINAGGFLILAGAAVLTALAILWAVTR